MKGRWEERKLIAHQLVLFGVFLLLTGWRLLVGRWSWGIGVYKWWLGGVVGFLFVFLDRLVWAFWQRPDETLSIKLRELFGGGKLWEGLMVTLQERREQKKMMIRSVLFLAIWVVLAILTMTSVSESFGRGFMLGIGVHLGFDLVSDYLGKGREIEWWFWQIDKEWKEKEIGWVVWGFVAVLVFLGWRL